MTRNQARRLQVAKRWHRRVALLVALWLAVLAVSGSAINRAHDWGLDRAPLPAALQGGLYGVERDDAAPCAGLDPQPEACGRAFARLATGAGSILLTAHGAVLLDPAGRPLETLPAGQLGLPRIDAGLALGDRVYLAADDRIVATDAELLDLRDPGPDELSVLRDASWRRAQDAGAVITWERLLLDLHAARFLGPAAPWFTDLMAAAILLLVLSGAWLYRQRNRNAER